MTGTDSMIILNQYEVGGHGFLLFLSIVAAIAVVVIGIVVVSYRHIHGEWEYEYILYFIVGIICFGIVFSGWLIPQINSYTVYEVCIVEDASLLEFIENYDIVSQKGEIYTIKEKE